MVLMLGSIASSTIIAIFCVLCKYRLTIPRTPFYFHAMLLFLGFRTSKGKKRNPYTIIILLFAPKLMDKQINFAHICKSVTQSRTCNLNKLILNIGSTYGR